MTPKKQAEASAPLDRCVRDTQDLRGTDPDGLHDMVLKAVEKPLLDLVMQKAEGNQCRAAEWLGINRNTLRRKLVEHKLIK